MLRTAINNAPRSGGSSSTLRASKSLPSLRAAARAHVQPAVVPVPPVPARTLVSSVLLSRDAYEKHNVAQLKTECKSRGLTTGGRKADLLTRLLNDDAKRSGSGLVEDAPAAAAKISQKRSNATLASLRGKEHAAPGSPSRKTEASPPTPPPAEIRPAVASATLGEGASIPHPESIQAGSIQSPAMSASEAAIKAPEKLDADSNPPGVPPQNEPSHPTTFKVDIPYEQVAPLAGPEIPIVTMYTKPYESAPETPLSSGPKVISTGGGADVRHALEPAGETASAAVSATTEAASSVVSQAKSALGIKGSVLPESARNLLNKASATASEISSSVFSDASSTFKNLTKPASSSSSSSSSSALGSGIGGGSSSSDGKRPLNSEEKKGLYVLGGLAVGGWAAGGLLAPKEDKKKH